MKEFEICPRCKDSFIPNNDMPGAYPGALSRVDNKTYICSECGVMEALMDSTSYFSTLLSEDKHK